MSASASSQPTWSLHQFLHIMTLEQLRPFFLLGIKSKQETHAMMSAEVKPLDLELLKILYFMQ